VDGVLRDEGTKGGATAVYLSIRIAQVKGRCLYKEGDSFKLVDGYKLVSDIPLCMHSLAALMPHYNALRVSSPKDWGLAGQDDPTKAYVQCLDAASHTGGGTAILEISKVEDRPTE
jgi:uncharacterized repeat protein (TIGR04076 family)